MQETARRSSRYGYYLISCVVPTTRESLLNVSVHLYTDVLVIVYPALHTAYSYSITNTSKWVYPCLEIQLNWAFCM